MINNKIILPANNIRGLILFKIVFINNLFWSSFFSISSTERKVDFERISRSRNRRKKVDTRTYATVALIIIKLYYLLIIIEVDFHLK